MTDIEIMAAKGRRAYMKVWRDNHKSKVQEYNLRYWARKAAEFAATETERKD